MRPTGLVDGTRRKFSLVLGQVSSESLQMTPALRICLGQAHGGFPSLKFLSQAEHLLQAVSRIQLACGCSQGHSLLPLPPRLYPWAAEEASFLKLPQPLRAARELLPLGLPIRALFSADLCEGLFSGGTLKPPESL